MVISRFDKIEQSKTKQKSVNVICKKKLLELKHFYDDDIMKYCLLEWIK